MKTLATCSMGLALLLACSGCGTTINAFAPRDYAFTHAGDVIMRGTNVLAVTQDDGIWLNKATVDRALDAKIKAR